jgi:cytochrome P450 family 12
MRSTTNPILMQPRIVKSYIPLIDGIVKDFIANFPKIQNQNNEMPGNFHEYLNRWTLESITAITLEKRLGLLNFENSDQFGMKIQKTIRKILNMGMEFEIKPSVWKIYHTKAFKEYLQALEDLTQ